MARDTLLREYIRAALLSLPDPRTGSGYGSTGKSASGLGSQYQKNNQFPYRDPDISLDDDCKDDQHCTDIDSEEESEETHVAIQNKTLGTHRAADPHKRRDYQSFSGHSVRFDLHQGAENPGPLLAAEATGISGRSITPIPNLYKGRQAAGAMGGASPSGMTTGTAPKGGVTSKRKFSKSQPLPRDEKMPRKFNLLDILFSDDEDLDAVYIDIIRDVEGKVEEEI